MPETVGVVPLDGRGGLPFADLHREVLFLHAVRSLLEVHRLDGRVVVTVDPDQRAPAVDALDRSGLPALVQDAAAWWRSLAGSPSGQDAGPVTLVLHDPLCPLVPGSFVASCLDEAAPLPAGTATEGRPVVAYRPVTDTIKTVVDDQIADTLDRDRFGIVASPVVFAHRPGAGAPPTTDFGELATWLRARGDIVMRKAPSLGRRVDDPSAVNLLECMDELARSVEES